MLFIITGSIHSGKTTLAREVIALLSREKLLISGFICEPVVKGGKCQGYDACDLKTGEKFPLLRKKGKTGYRKAGGFFFIPDGLTRAAGLISGSMGSDLVVIDELGPLEIMRKKGLWKEARRILIGQERNTLVVVRNSLLDAFCSLVEGSEQRIYHAGENSAGEIVSEIKKRLI